ncbi:MAG: hypothetical protein ACRDN9_03500 [Streptosporangiaceae bacterium]
MADQIDTAQLAAIVRTLQSQGTDTANDSPPDRLTVTARLAGIAERLLLDTVASAAEDPGSVWPAVERQAMSAGGWNLDQAPEVLTRRGVRLLTAIDATSPSDDPVTTAAGLAAAACTDLLDAQAGLTRGDSKRARASLELAAAALHSLTRAARSLPTG